LETWIASASLSLTPIDLRPQILGSAAQHGKCRLSGSRMDGS
jgi:hypothetical protein